MGSLLQSLLHPWLHGLKFAPLSHVLPKSLIFFPFAICCYVQNHGQVCWKCKASKGGNDLDYSYTNLHPGAAWRNTIWTSLPWVQTPELANCRGFDPTMLAADLLHVWHLGCGRDLLGSSLKILTQMRYFAGNSIEKSLGQASMQLRSYARQNGLMLNLKKLTKQNLGWTSDAYPEIRCKGYDTYIALSWLAKEIETNPPTSPVREIQEMLDEMCTAIWSADSWLRMLTHAPMHLTDSQQLQKTVLGNLFMTTYICLLPSEQWWRGRNCGGYAPRYICFTIWFLKTVHPDSTLTICRHGWMKTSSSAQCASKKGPIRGSQLARL